MKVLVTQSCPILYDPMDSSLPGSSLYGVLQARMLEWIAINAAIHIHVKVVAQPYDFFGGGMLYGMWDLLSLTRD